jgi:predicted transcriptional regulator
MARTTKTGAPDAARSAAHAAPAPDPAPDTHPAPADPAAAVQTALAARPAGATTADIASAAGTTRTAASKALTEMEAAGTAERTKGGRPGIPDTWHPAAALASVGPTDATVMAADSTTRDRSADEDPANTSGTSDGRPAQDEHGDNRQPIDGAAADVADPAEEPSQDGTAGTAAPSDSDDDQHPNDDGAEVAPDPAVTAAVAAHMGKIGFAAEAVTTALATGDLDVALAAIGDIWDQVGQARRTVKAAAGGRKTPAVKPGALRELVAAHLHAYPGENFTPHQIGKKLTRSSGAVANALDKLVALGEAELATEKPRSFRLADSPATLDANHAETSDADGAMKDVA